MSKSLNLSGKRFGKLTVVSKSNLRFGVNKIIKWECICDCGKSYLGVATELNAGSRVSCGCDIKQRIGDKNSTHGETRGGRTAEYACWKSMKDRCLIKTSNSYHNYGGRGVKICQRWMKFENFIKDLGRKPSPKHQLERKHNNGNYEPSNCCWATPKIQSRNRRTNVFATYNGKTQCALDWSREIDVPKWSVLRRLKIGWSIAQIIKHYHPHHLT